MLKEEKSQAIAAKYGMCLKVKKMTKYYPNVFSITEEVDDRGCSNPIQHLYRICTLKKLQDKLLTLQSAVHKELPRLKGYSVITIR